MKDSIVISSQEYFTISDGNIRESKGHIQRGKDIYNPLKDTKWLSFCSKYKLNKHLDLHSKWYRLFLDLCSNNLL